MCAFAGQFLSNLLFFESQMGWRGLCVEGSPLNFAALVRNRPLCTNVNAVVGPDIASATFFSFLRDGSWESAMSCMRGAPASPGCANEAAAAAFALELQATLVTHTVPGHTLAALFARANISTLGWASVDVEGAEEVVFRSADWTAAGTPARFITYEGARPSVAALLEEAGYVSAGKAGMDPLFVPGPALAEALATRQRAPGGGAGQGEAAEGAEEGADGGAAAAALPGR